MNRVSSGGFGGMVLAAMLVLAGAPAMPASAAGMDGTGLPLPRFVSLRVDQVNMRTGPGVRYPIDWVYLRPELPVEVIQEWQTWRKIRDPEGVEGWVHQTMLSGRRSVVTLPGGGPYPLRREAAPEASALAFLEPGVQARLLRCPPGGAYCRVQVNGQEGWLARDAFWGVYRNESVE